MGRHGVAQVAGLTTRLDPAAEAVVRCSFPSSAPAPLMALIHRVRARPTLAASVQPQHLPRRITDDPRRFRTAGSPRSLMAVRRPRTSCRMPCTYAGPCPQAQPAHHPLEDPLVPAQQLLRLLHGSPLGLDALPYVALERLVVHWIAFARSVGAHASALFGSAERLPQRVGVRPLARRAAEPARHARPVQVSPAARRSPSPSRHPAGSAAPCLAVAAPAAPARPRRRVASGSRHDRALPAPARTGGAAGLAEHLVFAGFRGFGENVPGREGSRANPP